MHLFEFARSLPGTSPNRVSLFTLKYSPYDLAVRGKFMRRKRF